MNRLLLSVLLAIYAFNVRAVEITAMGAGVVGKADGSAVRVDANDVGTNTTLPVMYLRRASSGVPATGIGAILGFQVETAADNYEIGATIEAVTTDVTATSEDFSLVAKTMVAGSTTLVTGYTVTGARFQLPAGTIAAPSLTWSQASNGFYDAGGLVGYAQAGSARMHLDHRLSLQNIGEVTWASTSTPSNRDTGLARNAAGVLKATNGSTGIRGLLGGGTAVASAAALPLPTGRVFHVTGTTTITSISSTNLESGVCYTAIFDDALTLTDGGNIVAAGNFVTTANDTWSACFDGTNHFETSRSIN